MHYTQSSNNISASKSISRTNHAPSGYPSMPIKKKQVKKLYRWIMTMTVKMNLAKNDYAFWSFVIISWLTPADSPVFSMFSIRNFFERSWALVCFTSSRSMLIAASQIYLCMTVVPLDSSSLFSVSNDSSVLWFDVPTYSSELSLISLLFMFFRISGSIGAIFILLRPLLKEKPAVSFLESW